MQKKLKTFFITFGMLYLLSLQPYLGSCLYAEEVYQVTETELTTLETNMKQLKTSLIESRRQVTKLQNSLTKQEQISLNLDSYNQELEEQQIILQEALTDSQNSLKKANESVQQLEKDMKKQKTNSFLLGTLIGTAVISSVWGIGLLVTSFTP